MIQIMGDFSSERKEARKQCDNILFKCCRKKNTLSVYSISSEIGFEIEDEVKLFSDKKSLKIP